MNIVTQIAIAIHGRGKAYGWKGKTADKLNFEAWVGAYAALNLINHPEAERVGTVVSLLIAPRGYSETVRMATKEATANAA